MEEVKENNEKINKRNKISIIVIICSLLVMGFCATYLIHSYTMLKKYDVDSFKLGDYVIPTLNSAIRTNRKLVVAEEEENLITLKYDITKMTLNDVYAYLGKLSLEDYIVVDLEDLYMRAVNYEKDIQIKIKVRSNHLVIEYNIGIDKDEESEPERATATDAFEEKIEEAKSEIKETE